LVCERGGRNSWAFTFNFSFHHWKEDLVFKIQKLKMRKRIIISFAIGIIIGIGAAKFYMAALHAGHAAYFFPDYSVGIIVGGLSTLIAFKYLKK
jgi:hypothetical protein